MINHPDIAEAFERCKGQFVITDNVVRRLIAVAEDDMDYYWVYYNGREVNWSTCVGGFIQLKGKIDGVDYKDLVRLAELNHFDQPNLWNHLSKNGGTPSQEMVEFNENHKREALAKYSGEHDRYITDIHWDIV